MSLTNAGFQIDTVSASPTLWHIPGMRFGAFKRGQCNHTCSVWAWCSPILQPWSLTLTMLLFPSVWVWLCIFETQTFPPEVSSIFFVCVKLNVYLSGQNGWRRRERDKKNEAWLILSTFRVNTAVVKLWGKGSCKKKKKSGNCCNTHWPLCNAHQWIQRLRVGKLLHS